MNDTPETAGKVWTERFQDGTEVRYPVTVDITDAVPGSVRIPVSELLAGDQVFDVFGTPHMLTDVRNLVGGVVRTKREDQTHFEYWSGAEDAITVLPVSETDTIHGRLPGDVVLYLGTDQEYLVVSVNRAPHDHSMVGYRVRRWSNPDAPVSWMPHNRFRRP